MAHIHPSGWQAMSVTGTAVRETDFILVAPSGRLLLTEQTSDLHRFNG
ncbi:hypothetical protein [Massilia aquatica]|nr:hypothetical protein [Massilia aquatica]